MDWHWRKEGSREEWEGGKGGIRKWEVGREQGSVEEGERETIESGGRIGKEVEGKWGEGKRVRERKQWEGGQGKQRS